MSNFEWLPKAGFTVFQCYLSGYLKSGHFMTTVKICLNDDEIYMVDLK